MLVISVFLNRSFWPESNPIMTATNLEELKKETFGRNEKCLDGSTYHARMLNARSSYSIIIDAAISLGLRLHIRSKKFIPIKKKFCNVILSITFPYGKTRRGVSRIEVVFFYFRNRENGIVLFHYIISCRLFNDNLVKTCRNQPLTFSHFEVGHTIITQYEEGSHLIFTLTCANVDDGHRMR